MDVAGLASAAISERDARPLPERRDDLERRMRAAARELKFEDAARLRDELKRVEALILHAGESKERAATEEGPADS